MRVVTLGLLAAMLAAPPLAAQMQHTPGMTHGEATAALPTSPGQAAYGAIQEIVAKLDADSSTDWSRVNIEALRQHLIDMNDVTMSSTVRQANVAGGARMAITGTGHTREAIQRMVTAHAAQLDRMPDLRATARNTARGAELVVTARNAGDSLTTLKIRGLGFAGLLTVGAHHPAHHLALARGEPMTDHLH